jgi:hypothetical protein
MYQEITRERQLAATVELAAEMAGNEASLAPRRSEPPRAGDTFLSRRTAEYHVEWLVVDDDEDGRVRVVPLDAHPFVGSRDLAPPERSPGDAAVLRCDLDAWLDASELEPELRTGTLSGPQVEDVRRKRRAIEEKSIRATLLEEEVDGDPEYRHWRESMLGSALAALQGLEEGEDRSDFEIAAASHPHGRQWWPVLVAASVLLAVAWPFAWQIHRLSRQLEDERLRLAEVAVERESLKEELASSETEIGRLETAVQELREATERTLAEQKERIEERLRRALDQSVVVNVPSLVLARAERDRAHRGLAESINPGDAPRFTLSLEVPDPEPYRGYKLQIVEKASGREIWSTDELVKVGGKWLRLDLPADLLEPVEYELLVYGLGSGPPELLKERYAVKLER